MKKSTTSGANATVKALVLALAGIGMATLPLAGAYANPQGGQVVAGSATIAQPTPTNVAITQTTDKAIIDWQSFSIGANEQVRFYQPSAASVTLNRVVGADPSQILGRLTANGSVFLVNPNGIYFGKNAQIDVAGLVASTHNIRNEDFLAGNYLFNIPGNPGAAVINEGAIRIADTGIAAFVAASVANRGVIVARLGKVALASANGFTLDFTGDQLITFLVNDQVAQTAFDLQGNQLTSFVENAGRIEAQGGYVLLTAKAAENAIHGVINQTGVIEATTVGTHKGTIILNAGTGSLNVAGTLDASAPNGGDGGYIDTSGAHVAIDPNAKITTSAPLGKTGLWLIDPTDYTIAASGGNITGASLAARLVLSNIEIQTLATGTGNGDIFVNDAVTWNTLNKLTLTAHRNVNVNAAINANGGGSVKLRADSLGIGVGTVNFAGAGHITVNNGATVGIYYNPVSYTDALTKSDALGNPYINNVTLGAGTGMTAYMLVNNVNKLQAINTNLSGNYALGKNIDASATAGWVDAVATPGWSMGAGFMPIGHLGNPFSGILDGSGQAINGLYINRPIDTEVGLIGTLTGIARNISVNNVSVTGFGLVGGLVGAMRWGSSLINTSSSGVVQASGSVGGLVGGATPYFYGNPTWCGSCITIDNSFSSATVSGNSSVGGFIGFTDQTLIRNSYATGTVNGVTIGTQTSSYIGGFIGNFFNSTELSNSYFAGTVNSTGLLAVGGFAGTSNSFIAPSTFFDSQKAGILTSAGGTGLTTAQMKAQASYAGWDFVNVWRINEGASYPTLVWQTVTADTSTTLTPPVAALGPVAPKPVDICAIAPTVCLGKVPGLSVPSNATMSPLPINPGADPNGTYLTLNRMK